MPTAQVNGIDLFYVAVGQGLPCLVMHGGPGLDHTYLHPWLDPLADVLRLVYYDHRANGRSGRSPPETLTLNQFAADADGLRASMGLGRVAVMGHSFGGFVALTHALKYPEQISHLILMDTAPAFDYMEEVMANARRKGASAEVMASLEAPTPTDDQAGTQMLHLQMPLYFHRFDERLTGRLAANMVVSAYAAASGERIYPSYNVVSQLREIQVPTLILVGRDDFICPPSQAERMHHSIANSELVIFEHSGHFPWVEEPDAFFAAVRSWLARKR